MNPLKSRQQLICAVVAVLLLVGCSAPTASPTTPPPSPTSRPPSPTGTDTPTSTLTPTLPPLKDVPIYNTSFEEITDLPASGITSTSNDVKLNTENVAFQSGSQSLEAYGTLAAPIYSSLTIEFSIPELTGEKTLDLSNKNIGFSFFIPTDSPIDSIILVAVSGTKQVSIAATAPADSWDQERGKWHYQQFDVKSIYNNDAWSYTNLSAEEAREVVRNTQVIMLAGMRSSDGVAVPASFFVDDFKWIGIADVNHIPLDDNVDSIRKYANVNNMKVGSVLFYDQYVDWYSDPWYLYTLAQEFNMTAVGGDAAPDAKPEDISAIEFDYSRQDIKLAFAEGNGMILRGGTGGWHTQNPLWLMDASYDELKAFLGRKIESDLTHFKGKVKYWGVFNEVINDEGNGFRNRQAKNPDDPFANSQAPYGYRYSPWVDGTDTSLIEYAFIKGHEADPDAKLFLNDFANEEIGTQKSEFFYNFVVGMKNRGIPIDGVGFQLHLSYPQFFESGLNLDNLEAYLDRVDRNIKRYAEAGLLIEFTEVECQIRFDDINLNTEAGRTEYARRQQKQTEVYAGLMKLAKENPNVVSFTFWTIADKPHTSAFDTSWFTFTYTDSFLFDKNYIPKPAYYAVLNVLKGK